jgi:aminocarboxymuconate-semialdehyde decarboxylase
VEAAIVFMPGETRRAGETHRPSLAGMQIDAYAHIVPPRFAGRVERLLAETGVPERIKLFDPWLHEDPALVDLDARWRTLEPFPDYRQVLVLGVFPIDELGPPEVTRALAREVNDELAELVAAYPDRFAGFAASLPLHDVDASIEELERARRDLSALGGLLHTNVNGLPLDDPRFEPLFARAHELDLALWLHPTRSPIWPDYLTESESKFGIWWSLGWPFETAVAMTRLVFSGHMERYPRLKVITHHAGGMIPHFSGRLDTIQAEDQREAFETRFKKPALDYFRQFYVDTAMFGAPHAVRCAVEFFGPAQVLFGTDMPLGGPAVIADTVTDLRALGLGADAEDAIFSGNAERVLGLS